MCCAAPPGLALSNADPGLTAWATVMSRLRRLSQFQGRFTALEILGQVDDRGGYETVSFPKFTSRNAARGFGTKLRANLRAKGFLRLRAKLNGPETKKR